ncbi:MAG: site-2 protease family protein [Thermoplasmata archaeon]
MGTPELAVNPYLVYEIVLLLVTLYAFVIYALHRAGRLGPGKPLSMFGPALMIKTQRGRAALDRWGRFRRFWTGAGDLGIGLAIIAMATILALLVLDAIFSFQLNASNAPPISEALGLPGINPIIPIGYGILALVVGIVLHELCHGVVARSQNIGVKSLGILWCVIPVGAFVEQDDTEMLAAPRRKRDRVAAAGVLANFALTILFFALLSGLVAASVTPNADGVSVTAVVSGTPAANATLTAGDLITSVNGTATPTPTQFDAALAKTTPNETIALVYYDSNLGRTFSTNVTLASNPNVKDRGFLGVGYGLSPTEFKQTLVWPPGSDEGPLVGSVYWLLFPLPQVGLEPIAGSTIQWYHISGPLAGLGTSNFWILANVLYWLAWMNLLLGMSNALPLFPLDGGLLFRDFMASVAARFRRGWSEARIEQFAGRAVTVSSLLVLMLLVWQFLVPRLL